MPTTPDTLKSAAALLHARGLVCRALRASSWDWAEIQALLKAEEQAAADLAKALEEESK